MTESDSSGVKEVGPGRRRGLHAVCNHPGFAVIVTLLGAVAGVLGSVYSSEIKDALPLTWTSPRHFFPEAALFWITLIVFAALFFGRQWATDQKSAAAQQLLFNQSLALEERVKTLPPQGFLTVFAETYDVAHAAAQNAAGSKGIERIFVEATIRMVIRSVVTLARAFDAQPPGIRYAGNVMVFSAADSGEPAISPDVRALVRFFDRDPSVLRGLLILEPALSAASDEQLPSPGDERVQLPSADPYLERFALPVDKTNQTPHGRYRQLPGAPFAFASDRPIHYDDTTTLGKWCREKGDFPESVAKEIDDYFQSEKATRIRSFVAIPIKRSSEGVCHGVLNLHCSMTDMLRGAEAFKLFFPLMEPFTVLLSQLLDLRERSQ